MRETSSGLLHKSQRNVRTLKNLKLSSERVFSPRLKGSGQKLRKGQESRDESPNNLELTRKDIQLFPINEEDPRSFSARPDISPPPEEDFEEMMRRKQFLDQLPLE